MEDLESYLEQFLNILRGHSEIEELSYQKYAGIPFLRVKLNEEDAANMISPQKEIQTWIKKAADQTATGSILSYECKFVRHSASGYLFRFRFLLPNQKMYCCGRFCSDCVYNKV